MCLLFFTKLLFSTKWQPFKNYEKCLLFHLKSSFCSQDIQFFLFPPSPLFLPVNHCGRCCLKINLQVYDVINCLNKNLITHFVWYLGKVNRYDIEILSIDRVLNKEDFYGKIMQKMHQKLVTNPFSVLVNNPKQPFHARNSFENKIFERGLSKTL